MRTNKDTIEPEMSIAMNIERCQPVPAFILLALVKFLLEALSRMSV
jgi:hypothetical protein